VRWGGCTKSYWPTRVLKRVAKQSLLVPSATDFSYSAKNLRYTLAVNEGRDEIPDGAVISVFAKGSPPLHKFG
jgi:hypothetical protein